MVGYVNIQIFTFKNEHVNIRNEWKITERSRVYTTQISIAHCPIVPNYKLK